MNLQNLFTSFSLIFSSNVEKYLAFDNNSFAWFKSFSLKAFDNSLNDIQVKFYITI